jgi:hypothetical protein
MSQPHTPLLCGLFSDYYSQLIQFGSFQITHTLHRSEPSIEAELYLGKYEMVQGFPGATLTVDLDRQTVIEFT